MYCIFCNKIQVKYFFRNSMKGHVDPEWPTAPFCIVVFRKYSTVEDTAGHDREDFESSWFDGILDKLSISSSPHLPTAVPVGGRLLCDRARAL